MGRVGNEDFIGKIILGGKTWLWLVGKLSSRHIYGLQLSQILGGTGTFLLNSKGHPNASKGSEWHAMQVLLSKRAYNYFILEVLRTGWLPHSLICLWVAIS